MSIRNLRRQQLRNKAKKLKITIRKYMNFDAMAKAIRKEFERVPDHRAKNASIPLVDHLMSAFAMFALKDPSMLAFDQRREEDPASLRGIFGIRTPPCDSQMRTVCDEVAPDLIRRPFRRIFSFLQRGKALENMTYLDGYYLLAIDGTGFYSSAKVGSPYCLKRVQKNGKTEYYQQMVAGAIVHPERREVIPFCPEMILQQDGTAKQDCERKATARFLGHFRREHPHLKCIVIEDGISSNAPHINDLRQHNLRFILGAKPGDHAFLFEQFDSRAAAGDTEEITVDDTNDPNLTHCYRYANGLSLNKSNQDVKVNMLEYWQVDHKHDKILRFSWVTDIEITRENAYQIMRAGRARWRIENETFNTLKNQGYNLGHNYGLGKKYLSAVLTTLMMLAFLVDQVQQLCCPLFQAARIICRTYRELWERIRGLCRLFDCQTMESVLRCIVIGMKVPTPLPDE